MNNQTDETPSEIEYALKEIESLKNQLYKLKEQANEPIAIIGMAMRLPGKITNEKLLWNTLINGIDCIEDIPINRWDKDALYDSNINTPGKLYVKQGGFIEDVEMLDGEFFNITPLELESTDPQQRLLLEVTHEAFENAGVNVRTLIGGSTGVYIGIDNVDYQAKQIRSKDYKLINGYCTTGTVPSGASGRIAYTMGLRGPCMTIDTACSSALTCTHVAVNALRNKDCDIAVVGAASLILEPDQSLNFCSLNALSPEARCKSFDDDANGFIRSEGVCIMIIKRLSDAQKNDDKILAIIKGTAINQDGKSKRFTSPSTIAQGMLHTQVLKNANLKPEDISYIEAHGTGTRIGDPAEIRGMLFAYEKFRLKENPIIIGSIKSNIGHMECNAGMASIFKIILALQNNIIPKSIHFNTPNTLVDWDNIPVKVAKENTNWPQKKRWASASGFGVTGSNANVILGDAPENKFKLNKETLRTDIFVLPISAKSENALIALAKKYLQFIKTENFALEDICAMASLRRAHFNIREFFYANSKTELIHKIEEFVELNTVENTTILTPDDKAKIVFVFPGQGSQWIGMAQNLLETESVFKQTLTEINVAYSKYVQWNLIDEIYKNEANNRYNEIDIIQPILVAIEIGLAKLWISKNVLPDIVVGHSLGEVAAAYIAQNISLDSAAKIICTRSKLMKKLSGKGVMGVTDLTENEAQKIILNYENKLSIAVLNSKNSTVIAGDEAALNKLFETLEQQGRFNKKINVDVASHSAQMDEIKDDLQNELTDLETKNSDIIFYSTATNQIQNGNNLDANYWVENLRNPVQFGSVIEEIIDENNSIFIEISPHPVLIHSINENSIGKNNKCIAISTLFREKNEQELFYSNFGKLYKSGVNIDWKTIYPNIGKFVQLPNYAWQKERYWFDTKPEINNNYTNNIDTKIPNDLFEIVWDKIDLNSNCNHKKIAIIKDGYNFASTLQQQLIDQKNEVFLIDNNSYFEDLNFDIIIHCSTFDKKSTFDYNLEKGILSLQKIVKKYDNTTQKPKIVVVTNGAFITAKETEINLNASLVVGLCRTLQNEIPEFNWLNIDISNQILDEEIRTITSLLQLENNIKEIAIRDNKIYVAALKLTENSFTNNFNIDTENTVLIIGGTSGLGLEYAKWLARKKVKNIAIASRNNPTENNQKIIDELQNENINIQTFKTNIGEENAIEKLILEIENTMPTIKNLVQCAGVLDDGIFTNLTIEQFNNVIIPKAIGTWNIAQYFKNRPLDNFIIFSSSATIIGSTAQSNYVAANMFLDQISYYLNNNGQKTTAINWGNIAEVGLASREAIRGNRIHEMGVFKINTPELFNYFETTFTVNKPQIIALKIDFNKWSETNTTIRNNYFYKNFVAQKNISNENKIVFIGKNESKNLTQFTSLENHLKYIKDEIKNNISAITKLNTAKIKENDTFKNIGIDSMMALQLKNKLQEKFEINLNVSTIWTHPTVEKYAIFLTEELKLNEKYITNTQPIVEEKLTSNIVENLSLEDLMQQLSSKLD